MRNLRTQALVAARPLAAALAEAFSTGTVQATTKTNRHDLVSHWDRHIEEQLKQALTSDGSLFWGEETGRSPSTGSHQVEWLVDPIDGTSNFVHGYPLFSISIAAIVNDEVVAGVVLDPMSQDEYSADHTGAYFNGQPLRSRKPPAHTSQYNLVTSFPAAEILQRAPEATKLFGEMVTTFATVRRLVSGALEICFVARGIADMVLGVDAKPWDVAAASYILRQSGGDYITNTDQPVHLAPHFLAVAPGRSPKVAAHYLSQIQQM